MRYVKETVNYELVFEKGCDEKLIGFADSDWAGDEMTGNQLCAFYLKSFVQQFVGVLKTSQQLLHLQLKLNMYLCKAAREGMWLLNLLSDFGFKICEDNQSCIKLANKWEH